MELHHLVNRRDSLRAAVKDPRGRSASAGVPMATAISENNIKLPRKDGVSPRVGAQRRLEF